MSVLPGIDGRASALPTTARRIVASARPSFPPEDLEAILPAIEAILRSGRLILGPRTREFEEAFGEYVGMPHAIAVSTCTAALQIALRFHGVRDREVILPTNNFIGVAGAVLAEGGIPVLADMDPESFCMDTDDALARITPRTAGVIAVHIAGRIDPGMGRMRMACESRGLFLLEDASHAHGASMAGRKAGSLAQTGCFSFYPTKLVTTGTGGMLVTRDAGLAEYARSVRHHGVGEGLEDVVRFGNDWCLAEINALLGIFQLRRLDENVAHRNRMVERYRRGLAQQEWVDIPSHPRDVLHAYYKFPVRLREDVDRDRLRRVLWTEFGIENGAIYDPPCHRQPVLRDRYPPGAFPAADAGLARQLCPPIHSAITQDEVDYVSCAMIAAAPRCRRA